MKKVALLAGQPIPDEVYLTDGLNAGIGRRGGILGMGSRYYMQIGLPMFHLHTVSQLEGVVAHEFGHHIGGDLSIAPWIVRTQAAIESAIVFASFGLANDSNPIKRKAQILQFPFVWYARIFRLATRPMLRAQEFAADRLAARIVGAAPFAEALRIGVRYSKPYANYLSKDVIPAVARGYEPPFLEGLTLCLKSYDQNSNEADTPDPSDSHPPLSERLKAIADLPPGTEGDDSPASSLLNNVPDLVSRLLLESADQGKTKLEPIPWAETAGRVILPNWRFRCAVDQSLLCDMTLASLPAAIAGIDRVAAKTFAVWYHNAPLDVARESAMELFTAALGLALHREVRAADRLRTGLPDDATRR